MDAEELLERYGKGERSFMDAQLAGANLQQAELSGADLHRANLAGARLLATDLESSRLVGADLVGADLRDANLQAADLQNANLRAARMQHADLREAMLGHASLPHCDLQHADLRGVDFRGADLQHADLQHTQLRYADFRGADLRHADLRGADLRQVELEGANLMGASIDNLTLRASEWTAAELAGAIGQGAEVWEPEELTQELRRVATGENCGLTLHFDAQLNALEDLTLRAAVVAILGADTSCRVVESGRTLAGCLVRVQAEDEAELHRLATTLVARPWEDKVEARTAGSLPFADVLPGADRAALSVLIDRCSHYELVRPGLDGARPTLEQTWKLEHTREHRLVTVLLAALGAADLRRWVAQAFGTRLLEGLPGAHASGKALALAVVNTLAARDLIDADFFEQLLAERPDRRRDIDFLVAVWGVAPPGDPT